jgi:hypothetical protein
MTVVTTYGLCDARHPKVTSHYLQPRCLQVLPSGTVRAIVV